MKVEICETCKHYKRCRRTEAYKPRDYHTIGHTWYYSWCKKHEERCLNIRGCTPEPDEEEDEIDKEIIYRAFEELATEGDEEEAEP